MIIKENIPLKDFTTFRIGGPANYFAIARNVDDVKEASKFAHDKVLQMFVLGSGSNILVSDDGFSGLVLKMEIGGIVLEEGGIIAAGAGVHWDDLVAYAVENGLYGLENLSLIPGTVGAAPVQNIGAYGTEAKDVISFVEAFDRESDEIRTFSPNECGFDYRTSLFKKPEGKKYIITRVGFALKGNGELNAKYKDVQDHLATNPGTELNLKNLRSIIIGIRTRKLPDMAKYGTAGSFFKNPIVPKDRVEELKKTYQDIILYPAGDMVKVSAAWLIDRVAGLRGFRDGHVGVYEKQALIPINFGEATALEIKKLTAKIFSAVKEKTGIELEREVEFVG